MKRLAPEPPSGCLPRLISEGFLWAGGCFIDMIYDGEAVHGHFSVFVVRTKGGVYMVDSGYPKLWAQVERQVEEFLGADQLDYIFPTHSEIAHAGLIGKWMSKYPKAIVIGDCRDYHLYYPEEAAAGRFRHVRVGDRLDLGDRELVFAPAIWRDMPTSLWAYDTELRVLYVADAFGFLHPHSVGLCDQLASEQPQPNLAMAQFFNGAAMHWTRYTDVTASQRDIDRLLAEAEPQLIASAHGALVDNVDDLLDFFKGSMSSAYRPVTTPRGGKRPTEASSRA